MTEAGDVLTFGNHSGQLGLGTQAHQLLACGREVFDDEAVVLIAAGVQHSVCVTAKGTLWSWCCGKYGKLGHGDVEARHWPTRLVRESFGGSPAIMVACVEITPCC